MRIFLVNKKNIFIATSIIILIFIIIIIGNQIFNDILNHNNTDKTPHSINTSFIIENNLSQETLDNLFLSNEKIAFLTFDDGPTIKATPKILDILKEENVKASFFVIGKYVKNHPDLVKRAYDEGHYIANHTYNHDNVILYKNKNSFLSEIQNTDIEISKAIKVNNYKSKIFRFPNGFSSNIYKNQKKEAVNWLNSLGYVYIDWNALNKDSEKYYSKTELLNNLKKTSKNKCTLVVLMHDTTDVSNSSEVLKDSITYLKQEGYVFKNFYDL